LPSSIVAAAILMEVSRSTFQCLGALQATGTENRIFKLASTCQVKSPIGNVVVQRTENSRRLRRCAENCIAVLLNLHVCRSCTGDLAANHSGRLLGAQLLAV
jgi:hypothetical protein